MKPRLGVYKFTSCDGCQLALLNQGEDLLALIERVELVHFPEAGPNRPEAELDIALIEGSISTPQEAERIRAIRARSGHLVALGACATAGGIQALRNAAGSGSAWRAALYPQPEFIATADRSLPIAALVHVDLELHGCPIDGGQLLTALQQLLAGGRYRPSGDSVCGECKRAGHACVLVSGDEPCLGPVTRAGCGAVCPGQRRGCYGCFGPSAQANIASLKTVFAELGLTEAETGRRLAFITAEAFRTAEKKTHD
ncbi:MAG: sulfhydrogenase subunit delta [Hydrogenophilaceae bacterium]|nr:sulfhydrogenase subunit delta [Hydrogenophilaceae bacterium]